MIPRSLPQARPLTLAFEQRFGALTSETSNLLNECVGLKEFLQCAIDFLSDQNNVQSSEQVAHYLMGIVDYLPEELEGRRFDIPTEVKTALYDLLRSHRQGIFGKPETPEKTIAKLKALTAHLTDHASTIGQVLAKQSYIATLQKWVNTAPAQEQPCRANAMAKILRCIDKKENSLNLSFLNLTIVPPLPADLVLKELNLSHNQLASLHGMPSQMPALIHLALDHNQLASLHGMPSQMPAMMYLSLDNNQLSSLHGMPSHMPTLKYLYLDHNQLDSLATMPEQISQGRATNIFLYSNPLSHDTITVINSGGYQATIEFDMAAYDTGPREVKPLDQEVQTWFPDMDGMPWQVYATRVEGKALATLLMRLHECASFNGAGHDDAVKELRTILQRVLDDETFRTSCFTAAQGSDANCHDNVQAIFDELRMLLANPATKNGTTLEEVVIFQKGRLAARLIDTYVVTLGPGGDPLESGMQLKKELSADLKFPIQFSEIKYAMAGVVSNDIELHKQKAMEYVMQNLTLERLSHEMADDVVCADFLRKTYPAMFVARNLLWQDALEQASTNASNIDDRSGSLLNAAKHLQLGDGKTFTALQTDAEQALLQKVALHAQSNLTMSASERAHWEVEELVRNPDWIDYIERQQNVQDASTEQGKPIQVGPRPELHDWTKTALKAEGINIKND